MASQIWYLQLPMKALLRGPTCVVSGVAVAGVPETDAAGPSLVQGAVSGVPGGYFMPTKNTNPPSLCQPSCSDSQQKYFPSPQPIPTKKSISFATKTLPTISFSNNVMVQGDHCKYLIITEDKWLCRSDTDEC